MNKAGVPFVHLCLRFHCVSKSIQCCSSLGYPFMRLRRKCISGAAKLTQYWTNSLTQTQMHKTSLTLRQKWGQVRCLVSDEVGSLSQSCVYTDYLGLHQLSDQRSYYLIKCYHWLWQHNENATSCLSSSQQLHRWCLNKEADMQARTHCAETHVWTCINTCAHIHV